MNPSHTRSLSASSSTSSNGRSPRFPPLSAHGLPKQPSLLSPNGSTYSHRFSDLPSPRPSMPASPRPSGLPSPRPSMSSSRRPSELPMTPMTPPMSAKSFGTLIDSEPSTPAYSPRMGSTWESSQLVLLAPVSPVAATVPSPSEPIWDMMVPIQKPPKRRRFTRHLTKPSLNKEASAETVASRLPTAPIKEESTSAASPAPEDGAEQKVDEEQPPQSAPLEKLATRMKAMLRRMSEPDRNREKKRKDYYDLDRVETVHWTEL